MGLGCSQHRGQQRSHGTASTSAPTWISNFLSKLLVCLNGHDLLIRSCYTHACFATSCIPPMLCFKGVQGTYFAKDWSSVSVFSVSCCRPMSSRCANSSSMSGADSAMAPVAETAIRRHGEEPHSRGWGGLQNLAWNGRYLKTIPKKGLQLPSGNLT